MNSRAAHASEHREFGSVSSKLAFLLGLSPRDRVLLAGPRGVAWSPDFGSYFSGCHVGPTLAGHGHLFDGGPFDLLLWDATADPVGTDVGASLRRARAAVAQTGALVLVARNRWAPRRYLELWRRGARVGPARSVGGYASLLRAAGFGAVRTFLPMPGADNPEEFVAGALARYQLPDNAHWLLKLANDAGIYGWMHDAYLFIASPSPRDAIDALATWLAAELAGALDSGGALRLQRFDLRERGALVLFLEGPTERRLVARVAVTEAIDERVGRNAAHVRFLREHSAAGQAVVRRLPVLLGRYTWRGRPVYVEKRIEGILAWKVARDDGRRGVIDTEAREFALALGDLTRRTGVFDDVLLDRLLDAELHQRAGVIDRHAELSAAVERLARVIRRDLAGRSALLAFAHGDYGYGNLLVDEESGRLQGVIDWDCARRDEVWGVDWCNYAIQRRRFLERLSVGGAVRALAGDAGAGFEGLGADAAVSPRAVLGLACLRFVLRAAEYPDQLARHEADYTDAVSWLEAHYDEVGSTDAHWRNDLT